MRSWISKVVAFVAALFVALGMSGFGAGLAMAKVWACTAYDAGNDNPGASCPASGAYADPAISLSDGYNTFIQNDMWNPVGGPQTVYANSPGNWEVVSKQPAGNTAVVSYPDVQQIYTTDSDTPDPLSGFDGIYSDFHESMPSGGDSEAAFDIWLGNSAATNYAQEVMIWVDDHRTNPPPGKIVGTPTFWGAKYTVWEDPTDGASGFHTIYLVRDHNETSGRIHIRTMLDWLVANGLAKKDIGLNEIDFGWEICSTNGHPWTFTISQYGLQSGYYR